MRRSAPAGDAAMRSLSGPFQRMPWYAATRLFDLLAGRLAHDPPMGLRQAGRRRRQTRRFHRPHEADRRSPSARGPRTPRPGWRCRPDGRGTACRSRGTGPRRGRRRTCSRRARAAGRPRHSRRDAAGRRGRDSSARRLPGRLPLQRHPPPASAPRLHGADAIRLVHDSAGTGLPKPGEPASGRSRQGPPLSRSIAMFPRRQPPAASARWRSFGSPWPRCRRTNWFSWCPLSCSATSHFSKKWSRDCRVQSALQRSMKYGISYGRSFFGIYVTTDCGSK